MSVQTVLLYRRLSPPHKLSTKEGSEIPFLTRPLHCEK